MKDRMLLLRHAPKLARVACFVLVFGLLIERAFATAYGTTLGFSCTQDHSSVCVISATTRIKTDEKSPEVKANFTAQSTGRTCLSASLNVKIDDQLVYTTPMLSAGSSVSKISLGTFAPGIHTVNITEAAYDASACAYPNNGSNNMYDIIIGMYPSTSNSRTFSVTSGSAVNVGQTVSFSGSGWKKKGHPIRVLWNGKLVKSFPAAAKFKGHFKLWDFPDKNLSTCEGSLTAYQGSAHESVKLTGTADRYVYLGSGIEKGDGKPVKGSTVLCTGAEPKKERKHYWVWKTNLSNVRLPGLSIDDTISRVQATHVFAGPLGRIILSRTKNSKAITIAENIGPSLLTNLPSFDPKNTLPDIVVEVPSHLTEDVLIDSFSRSEGDLLIEGDVTLDNGYLYVGGALTVVGSVKGSGALISNGNMILQGPIDLVPGVNNNPIGGFSLLSGGELVLGHER